MILTPTRCRRPTCPNGHENSKKMSAQGEKMSNFARCYRTSMLRLLQIFTLLIVGFLFNSQQSAIVEHHVETVGHIEPAEKKHHQPSDLGCFKVALPQSGTINNHRSNVRTISTRTLRTSSTNGTAKWRCCNGSFFKTYNNLLTSKRWKDALRIESAPFHFTCPCDYYVITLRRIIR